MRQSATRISFSLPLPASVGGQKPKTNAASRALSAVKSERSPEDAAIIVRLLGIGDPAATQPAVPALRPWSVTVLDCRRQTGENVRVRRSGLRTGEVLGGTE